MALMALNWSVCSFSFYVLGYYIDDFDGNLYVNAVLMASADIIASVLSIKYLDLLSYNYAFSLGFTITTLSTILYVSP